jgi:hypothetical protein
MNFIIAVNNAFGFQSLAEFVYSFDCTFFRFICLTAKASRRITMLGFLVGATEPKKYTFKRVQLRNLG